VDMLFISPFLSSITRRSLHKIGGNGLLIATIGEMGALYSRARNRYCKNSYPWISTRSPTKQKPPVA
jgi:hypothetical protein